MADAWLQSNVSGPWSTSVQALSYNMGVRFQVSSTKVATTLRWQRVHVGSPAPQNLTLYSTASGGTQLAVVAANDNGALGWQESAIAGVTLTSGNTYIVSAQFPASFVMGYIGSGIPTATHDNTTIQNPARAYVQSSSVAYPNNTDNAWQVAVDVYLTDSGTAPDTGVVSFADIDAAFLAWEGAPPNDHPTALPTITYNAITDATDGLPGVLSAIADVSANMLTSESAILGDVIEKIDDNTAWMTALAGPAGALLTGALRTYLDNLKSTADDTLALAGRSAAGPGGILHSTDPGWEEVDSGAFTGSFFVDARCDRVYVHITTIGEDRVTNEVEGFEFLTAPFPWYAIFANMVGPYQTCMAREAVLTLPGVRMDGVLVKLPPDYEGTWTASMYTG